MEGEKHFLSGLARWLERLVFRALGRGRKEQRGQTYTLACSPFSCFTMLVTYALPAAAGPCCP